MLSSDEQYMKRCIQLAQLGKGRVAPNPLVGAVIVHEGIIIGEGYHQQYGSHHAEVNAVNQVKQPELFKEATIYVSLEPCAHHGKTPPCADLIVKKQFKRVVIGCSDSFSLVSGKGVQRIREHGIDVTIGVLEDECRQLNEHFFHFHEQKKPFVHLKWAQCQNGFIDNHEQTDGISWISQPSTQVITHQLRNDFHAILIGSNTAINDNPSLTTRSYAGSNPIRIVLDTHLSLPDHLSIFNSESPTIVINTIEEKQHTTTRWIKVSDMEVNTILSRLHQENIQSILVEGGRTVLQAFIDSNNWNSALMIKGTNAFVSGTPSPIIRKTPDHQSDFFGDTLIQYSNS